MPEALCTGGLHAVAGKVYYVGGFNAGGTLAYTLEYDPQADDWSYKNNLQTATHRFCSVAIDDAKIVIVGGHETPTLFQVSRT